MIADAAHEFVRQPAPWPFSTAGTAVRLFATCWLIFMLHSATNIAREHYLAFAIGDRLSFQVDDYQGLHPDLFETPGRGWHINNNPGVSMMAAVPYAAARPVIDVVTRRVRESRAATGLTEPPSYDTPWPNARRFYAEAWRRGLDVKFGLGAMVIQAGLMAPASALAVVGMFLLLTRIINSARVATWLALLFAFGTPVFFRTGYLNHNLLAGYVAAAGFVLLWNPMRFRVGDRTRHVFAGAAGGAAVLLDYSGLVLLTGLFAYGCWRSWNDAGARKVIGFTAAFGAGAAGPLALLAFYQWRSFGNPWLPAQQWMPDVAWASTGFRGVNWPMPDLLAATLFDYRYGLFVACPLALFAVAAPWIDRGRWVPRRETLWILAIFAAFWLFCGSVNYGRLQFNTGIRYMTSMLPFLFLLAAAVIVRLPRSIAYAVVVISVTISWSLAMHRDVERGFGVLDPVLHVMIGGFELPVLTTISRMGGSLGEIVARGVTPLPLFALTAAVLFGVWRPAK